MYCSVCGQKNPDEARFCAYCGARLLTAPLPEQEPDTAPEWEAESIFDKPVEMRTAEASGGKPEIEARVPMVAGANAVEDAQPAQRYVAPESESRQKRNPEMREGAASRAVRLVDRRNADARPVRQPADAPRAARRERSPESAPRAAGSGWERPKEAQGRTEARGGAQPRKPARIVASHSATRAGDVVRADHAPKAEYSPWAKPTATDKALRAARNGAPSTIVPRRGGKLPPEQEPEDLFFDGYDEEPEPPRYVDPREEDEREEMRRLSYVEKNVRGFIGVGLTMLTLLILAAWLFLFPSGQMMLARFGLTDSPTAYAGIARSAYDGGNYATAAKNYYQALLLDDDNYEYAISTADCYMKAGNTGSAATALTMAIDINASDKRAYQLLQRLYPDAQTRPTAVAELLSQGATLTGDSSLTQ